VIQSLRIVRKDALHLWPEITLHTALLIAFAWIAQLPHQVIGAEGTPLVAIGIGLIKFLLPVIWVVLIGRLVHDEALVGDQQFWITRPYTWPSLLGAKLLFLVAFIFVPFLLMQSFLLLRNGIHPWAVLPGLLLNLLTIILLCFLPFLVLASVTSTFPRLALAIIIAILYVIAVAAALSYAMRSQLVAQPIQMASTVVLVLLLLGALIYQYATRKTLYARLALYATPVVLALLVLLVPAGPLLRQMYPVDGSASGLKLTFDANPLEQQPKTAHPYVFDHMNVIAIPTQVSGLPPQNDLEPRGVTYTVDADSLHYRAPWQNGGTSSILVPETILAAVGDKQVHLHLTVLAERLAPGTPYTVSADPHFPAPEHGACSFPNDGTADLPLCNFALHSLPLTIVSGPISARPCERYSSADPGALAQGLAHLPLLPRTPSFDPVVAQFIGPMRFGQSTGFLCPGEPLTFNVYQSAAKLRFELDIPSIQLSNYVLPQRERHPQVQEQP